jgi:hypothetical protein
MNLVTALELALLDSQSVRVQLEQEVARLNELMKDKTAPAAPADPPKV